MLNTIFLKFSVRRSIWNIFLVFLSCGTLNAQVQILALTDSTFGENGRVALAHGVSASGSSGNGWRSLKLYENGKILLAATSKPNNGSSNREYFATRLNADGTPDSSFSDSASIFINGEPNTGSMYNAEIGPDNQIILVGNRQNPFSLIDETFLVKLKENGSPDSSFGMNGIQTLNVSPIGSVSQAFDAKFLGNGKIIIAAQVRFASGNPGLEFCVIRLNQDGSLDTDFGENGRTFIINPDEADTPYRMAIQNDGKILVAGISSLAGTPVFKVARINDDGIVDTTFGNNGTVIVDRGTERTPNLNDLLLQDDGKILMAGNYSIGTGNSQLTIVRLMPDGSLDEGFGTAGIVNIVPLSIANKLLINPDKSILAIGRNFDQVAIAHLHENGELDESFGNMGAADLGNANPSSSDLTGALLPDGKVLIGGVWTNNSINYYSVLKVKFVPQGSTSFPSFSKEKVRIFPNPAGDYLYISDPDGQFNKYRVFDSSGRLILESVMSSGEPVALQTINPGLYFLELSGTRISQRTKFIHQ